MYLLFDLDGTLTKPEMGITNSIKYALNKFGIVETDGAKLRLCIGPPLIDSFMDVWGFDQTKAELAVELYREYFTDRGLFENEVYDGIHTLLKELCEQGHHIFLATSKPEEYATRILEHFDLLEYFTAVVGNTLKEERPKKEDVLRYILDCYPEINPKNAIMIGDRKYDVIGAKTFGIQSVGVLYGYGSEQELQEAGADYICKTVAKLAELLKEQI